MKTIAISFTVAALLVMLSGCAGSPRALSQAAPEQLAKENNYNLCRAAFSRHATQAIESEVKSRKLDCGPYVAAAAKRDAEISAGLANISKSLQQTQPVTTNCRTYGNTTNCSSY